jgi:hypothetical protein
MYEDDNPSMFHLNKWIGGLTERGNDTRAQVE